MANKYSSVKNNMGFTLVETLITIGILSIMLGIAVFSISKILPGYRLKRAAQDLYSNMQSAKMEAVRTNIEYAIEFDEADNSYNLNGIKVVSLAEYGSGVRIGKPDGTEAIGYADNNPPDTLIFTSRGLARQNNFEEWVYIKNNKNKCLKVGTSLTGFIKMQRAD